MLVRWPVVCVRTVWYAPLFGFKYVANMMCCSIGACVFFFVRKCFEHVFVEIVGFTSNVYLAFCGGVPDRWQNG